MSSVSVVIPLYNAGVTIGEQLDALLAQTEADFEVIVADNGSSDRGADVVRRHGLAVTLVDASGMRGPSFARNRGAEAASGDKLLFCDADDVVDVRWVETLAAALERYDLAGGALELSDLNAGIAAWTNTGFDFMGREPLPYVASSNFAIRRGVFDELGGWRAHLLAGEDAALCWQAQLAGYTLGYEPAAVVHYRLPDTMAGYVAKQYRYGRYIVRVEREFAEFFGLTSSPLWKVGVAALRRPPRPSVPTVGAWLGGAAFAFGRAVEARSGQQTVSDRGSVGGAASGSNLPV